MPVPPGAVDLNLEVLRSISFYVEGGGLGKEAGHFKFLGSIMLTAEHRIIES